MKLKVLSLVLATVFFFSCGTTYNSTTSNAAYGLPSNIRTGFIAKYPDATNVTYTQYDAANAPIDWELNGWSPLTNSDYTVSFDMGGRKYNAWYTSNGAWVGTTYAITDYTTLPYAVNTMLKDKYKDYTIESAQRESWKDQVAYELNLVNGDAKMKVLVDANGNVLKEKTK
jgi:hypothetical protein